MRNRILILMRTKTTIHKSPYAQHTPAPLDAPQDPVTACRSSRPLNAPVEILAGADEQTGDFFWRCVPAGLREWPRIGGGRGVLCNDVKQLP